MSQDEILEMVTDYDNKTKQIENTEILTLPHPDLISIHSSHAHG